jgi:hypothetical protein
MLWRFVENRTMARHHRQEFGRKVHNGLGKAWYGVFSGTTVYRKLSVIKS